ncbi:MAG: aspartate kinase, partial [Candidatus Methanomethylicota archaeon]
VVARTFAALAKEGVDVLMISQSSSMANISIVIQKKDLDKALKALKEEFKEGNLVKEILVKGDVSVIAAVGEGMKGTPGVAAKVFSAVAERGVNILMISQGSSELNISFAIEEKDLVAAVNAVHTAFKLNES